jgi:fumarylacetoacetate (FAA) hydrolase family protein
MSSSLPIAEMIARLETKIALHREKEELHAKEEAVHAQQRALHGAEHRKAAEQLEALKAVSAAVGELIADVRPVLRAGTLPEKVKRGKGHWISDLLERVIEAKAPGEVFGATSLIAEIGGLWGPQLRHRIDSRSAAATLRRWAAYGLLDVVRKGTSHREGLYTKPRQD